VHNGEPPSNASAESTLSQRRSAVHDQRSLATVPAKRTNCALTRKIGVEFGLRLGVNRRADMRADLARIADPQLARSANQRLEADGRDLLLQAQEPQG
jgi:hypothetical protein